MRRSWLCSFLFLSLQKAALSEESCGATIKVSAPEGGDVTLPAGGAEIRIISWRRDSELTYIARTAPGTLYLINDRSYKGRLNVTAEGALIITKLNPEDQGVYRAEIERRTWSPCVQLYDLTVPGAEELTDYTALNIVRLILSACVFLIACCVSVHHLITEMLRRQRRTDYM